MAKVQKVITALLFGGVRPWVRLHIRALVKFRDRGQVRRSRFVEGRLQRKYGLFLSHQAIFPRSVELAHPTGVVVGAGVRLGARVKIYQHVTLGGARVGDWQVGNYPTVGDDTVIFAGAVIVGNVTIGRNCIIGANSVVTRDVPDNATAVGAPARVIKMSDPKVEENQ